MTYTSVLSMFLVARFAAQVFLEELDHVADARTSGRVDFGQFALGGAAGSVPPVNVAEYCRGPISHFSTFAA